MGDQLLDVVRGSPIEILCNGNETNLTSLESDLRNARYFLASNTTRNPK
jgi:hypothetical protein